MCVLVGVLPHEDGGVPPKHVAINKMCIILYMLYVHMLVLMNDIS